MLCPTTALCTAQVRFTLNTNGDLVTALDRTLAQLEICAIAHHALQSCINDYNNSLKNHD